MILFFRKLWIGFKLYVQAGHEFEKRALMHRARMPSWYLKEYIKKVKD